jgi:hypothetical protein
MAEDQCNNIEFFLHIAQAVSRCTAGLACVTRRGINTLEYSTWETIRSAAPRDARQDLRTWNGQSLDAVQGAGFGGYGRGLAFGLLARTWLDLVPLILALHGTNECPTNRLRSSKASVARLASPVINRTVQCCLYEGAAVALLAWVVA